MDAKPRDLTPGGSPSGQRSSLPWWAWGCSAELGPGDIANARRYVILSAVWAASLILALLALDVWADALGLGAYAIALIPTAGFLAVVWAYVRFLRGADELTRKIHLEGMAVGFGVGLVCILGYPVLESAGAPALDLIDASFPIVGGYVVAIVLAQRRYR